MSKLTLDNMNLMEILLFQIEIIPKKYLKNIEDQNSYLEMRGFGIVI